MFQDPAQVLIISLSGLCGAEPQAATRRPCCRGYDSQVHGGYLSCRHVQQTSHGDSLKPRDLSGKDDAIPCRACLNGMAKVGCMVNHGQQPRFVHGPSQRLAL